MPKLLRLLLSIFAVLSLGVALAACGDDDDADTDDTTTTEAADEATDEGEEAGDETPCAEGGSGVLEDPENPPAAPADDATAVTVTATEDGEGASKVYSFSDNITTDLASPGSYALSLENDGEELHEAIVSRINDDETRSVSELLAAASGGEDPTTFSTDVGAAYACPGTTSDPVGIEIESAGRYLVLCFFPVGATPDTPFSEFPEGPPHAAQGMVTEVAVS